MAQLRVSISGRVQGVSFRYYTTLRARELNLTGWVRNCDNGTVEVVACGERTALESLLSWLRHGPPTAQVSQVVPDWSSSADLFESFEIRDD